MDVSGNKTVFHRLGPARNRTLSNKSEVCYHWQAGRCRRHPCPFLHGDPTGTSSSYSNGGGVAATMSSKRPHSLADGGFSIRKRAKFKNTCGRGGAVSNGVRGVVKKSTVLCNYWIKGSCCFGNKCKYLHSWVSLLNSLEGHQKAVTGIALPSGSDKLYTQDETMRIWDCQSGQVLKWEDVEIGEPQDGEIRVKHKAFRLNFIDTFFGKGVYKAAEIPFTPGMEVVGEVIAVGSGLTERKVGDIVAYAGYPMGAYADEQILPASAVVPVPSSIDPVIAASVMLEGMTAQYLLRQCFKVQPGHTVLIHTAGGGTGSLLCQWANALGATVIGTVSTEEKAVQAKSDGCHHVIIYKQEDFVSRINEITSGQGVDVVYDSVGKDTFEGSLECLKIRGYMVLFGLSSGSPDPVPIPALAKKSVYLTMPSLMQYNCTRDKLLEASGELFANIASGVLRVPVNRKYPLSEAVQAYADLESGKTSGSVVLIPNGF